MFLCPRCRKPLEGRRDSNGVQYVCSACAGRSVGIGVLRQTAPKDAIDQLWQLTASHSRLSAMACPACRLPMLAAPLPAEAAPLEVDVCRRCHLVWFDPGERDAMGSLPSAAPPELSQQARVVTAMFELERIAERNARDRSLGEETPDAWWKWIPGYFGLPVEWEDDGLARLPWVTWLLALALLAVLMAVSPAFDAAVTRFGFLPADAAKWGGLSLLTAFFVHGSLWHGLSHGYFLLAFGDNVEDALGRWRFAVLLLFCHVASLTAHGLAHPDAVTPVVGTGGALSGVLAFYSLRFPHARLGILHRWYAYLGWLTLPAWLVCAIWAGLQALGWARDWEGFRDVSTAAHLGGAIAGLCLWRAWRDS